LTATLTIRLTKDIANLEVYRVKSFSEHPLIPLKTVPRGIAVATSVSPEFEPSREFSNRVHAISYYS